MTTASASDHPLGRVLSDFDLGPVLAVVAIALLVFVSGGVLYLSAVEWRDRRRRGAPSSRG